MDEEKLDQKKIFFFRENIKKTKMRVARVRKCRLKNVRKEMQMQRKCSKHISLDNSGMD